MSTPSEDAEARRLTATLRELIHRLACNEVAEASLVEAADLVSRASALLEGPASERWYEASAGGGSQAPEANDAYLLQSPIRGELNPIAPPLSVERGVREDGTPCIHGHARMTLPYEGPPRGVHGGWIAALMDDLLGEAQHLAKHPGVTAKLEVKYREVTPIDEDLRLEAWVESEGTRRTVVHGTIHAGDRLTVEATGLFIAVDFDAMHQRMRER